MNEKEQDWAAKQSRPFVERKIEEAKNKHACAYCKTASDPEAHRTEQACLKLNGKVLGKF